MRRSDRPNQGFSWTSISWMAIAKMREGTETFGLKLRPRAKVDKMHRNIAALEGGDCDGGRCATTREVEAMVPRGTGSDREGAANGLFTEIQPGSQLFMKSHYRTIRISETNNPSLPSLFVVATLVSETRLTARRCVPGGRGSRPTAASRWRSEARRPAPTSASWAMRAPHSALSYREATALGETIAFLPSHCDRAVDLYGTFEVARRDRVVDLRTIQVRH